MAVVGANMFSGGWFALRIEVDTFALPQARQYSHITGLMDDWGDASHVLLGVPIGLPDAMRPARRVDREARRLLGAPRNSSVFPVPSRETVEAFRSGQATTYQALSDLNRRALSKRLSRQTAALLPKIAEVDELLLADAAARRKIREAHRELCFWGLNGRHSMAHAKTTPEGLDVLGAYLPRAREFVEDLGRESPRHVPHSVVLDTLATALTAGPGHPRLSALQSIPADPQRDARGLPMEMVYRLPRSPASADGA